MPRFLQVAEYRNMMFAALANGARGILNYTLLVVLNTNRKVTRPVSLTLPAGFVGPLTPAFAGYPVGLTNNARTVTGSIGPSAVHVYRVSRA